MSHINFETQTKHQTGSNIIKLITFKGAIYKDPTNLNFNLFFFCIGSSIIKFQAIFSQNQKNFHVSWNTHKMFLSQCINNCLCLLMRKRILCFAQKTKMGIKFKFQLLMICILSAFWARNSISLFFYLFTLIHIWNITLASQIILHFPILLTLRLLNRNHVIICPLTCHSASTDQYMY